MDNRICHYQYCEHHGKCPSNSDTFVNDHITLIEVLDGPCDKGEREFFWRATSFSC